MKKLNNLKAFTLVELSIVLVIIGLLTAGVVGGQSLIESAKQRNFITTMEGYRTGTRAFQLEYDAIPGDFNNGFAYWSTNCAATAGDCNGDGGGTIGIFKESTGFFKHLSLAGILPGNYTMSTSAALLVAGTNAGKTPYEGIVTTPRVFTASNCLTQDAQTLLESGGASSGAGLGLANTLAINGKTVASIDRKIDDGAGCSGIFTGYSYGSAICPAWDAAKGTNYTLSSTGTNCAIIMKLQ